VKNYRLKSDHVKLIRSKLVSTSDEIIGRNRNFDFDFAGRILNSDMPSKYKFRFFVCEKLVFRYITLHNILYGLRRGFKF
jgi:hypothetical protein